jgi:hypothetical protein
MLQACFVKVSRHAEDPNFVAAPGDLRLRAESPCIDRGNAAAAPTFDLLGRARPTGNGFELGAYEYQAGDDDVGAGGAAGAGHAANAGSGGLADAGASGQFASAGDDAGSGGEPDGAVTAELPPPVQAGGGCSCYIAGAPTDGRARFGWLAVLLIGGCARRQRARAD